MYSYPEFPWSESSNILAVGSDYPQKPSVSLPVRHFLWPLLLRKPPLLYECIVDASFWDLNLWLQPDTVCQFNTEAYLTLDISRDILSSIICFLSLFIREAGEGWVLQWGNTKKSSLLLSSERVAGNAITPCGTLRRDWFKYTWKISDTTSTKKCIKASDVNHLKYQDSNCKKNLIIGEVIYKFVIWDEMASSGKIIYGL